MSSLTNKKLGYNDLNDYIAISSSTSSNLVKVDQNTGGWNFAGSSTEYAHLSIMKEEPMYVSHILSLQILINLKDITYDHIPYVQIRTQPTGTDDYSPEFHDELRYKIRDTTHNIVNNELIMFYQSYEQDSLETTTTARAQMDLIETLGTHDPNLPIQSIRLVSNDMNAFDYTVLAMSHNSNGVTRRKEITTLSNFDISDGLRQIEKSTKVLENRTQYESHRGRSQIFLGTSPASALLADSTIVPKVDIGFRDGMYFQNTVAGTKYNLYKFGGTAEVIRFSHIENMYAKLFIDGASMPFFHIYTKPLGDGTDGGAFYNSLWTYTFEYANFTSLGVECILYAGVNKPTLDIDFNVQQYKHTDVTITGPGTDGEILYMAIGTDSSDAVNTVQHCINLVGFKSDDDNGTITEKNFSLVSKVGENIGRSSRDLVLSVAVPAEGQIGDNIDLEGLKNLVLYGFASGEFDVKVEHSDDGSTWYFHSLLSPVVNDTINNYNLKISDGLRYIRLVNTNQINTFHLKYTIF